MAGFRGAELVFALAQEFTGFAKPTPAKERRLKRCMSHAFPLAFTSRAGTPRLPMRRWRTSSYAPIIPIVLELRRQGLSLLAVS
jgi:hypothetical protein